MKRFNCTLSDKRGEFGECMEAHSTGRYVLFSDVERLQQRMQDLLDKSNRTGLAIERAISTGSVLADHPLKSRLELLANHHKREQALADGMVAMADRCQLLTDLLKEVTQVIPAIGVTTDDMPVVDAFLERIEDAVSGEDSHQTGITLSAADLVELADFCSPDRDTDPEQLETEIVLFYRRAFKSTDGDDMPAGVYVHLADYPEEGLFGPVGGRRLVGERLDHPDSEWTDATPAPTEQDYRELQVQHDQVQSRLKGALDTLQLALPYVEHAIEFAPSQQISEGHKIFAAHIAAALTGDRGEPIAMMQEQNPADALVLMSDIASLQRYTLGGHCDSFGQDCGAEMEQDDEGEYVLLAEALVLPAAPIPSGGEPCAIESPSSSPD
ncbi:hypothetical protein G4923_06500 [Aeromonas rivipollensis]|uniref:Uncharacterized protein n=1 Tax=Aeromonas rivipollensis TaxID=948519 RepID=A0ABX0CWR4_9GAMM|nr:hypothetical protein [Aeromonas rivipollensis]NEX88362.1 hypothetical protein [Aeromonas rivipollensis]NEY06081.1 hypothetical protein [Aeromonas rivipollensis]